MAGRRRAPRARVLAIDRNRFAAGWRLIPGAFEIVPTALEPDLVVDLVRPSDLVALTVEGFDVELVGGEEPAIKPKQGTTGRLVVRLAYQHLAERAIYEVGAPVPDPSNPDSATPGTDAEHPADGEAARPIPPVPARPARTSRLVFELPAGQSVPFSSSGILEALGRLELLVHPLAKPRTGRARAPADGTVFHLPGGLIATAGADALVVSRAPRSLEVPDPRTAAGLSALARDLRKARSFLATRGGTSVVGIEAETGSPGDVTIGEETFAVPTLLGRTGLIQPDIVVRPRPRPTFSRPPRQFETAIEAPYRLVISPSERGGWTHANAPVAAEGAPHRIELWHTRLGVRVEEDDEVIVDERTTTQRVVRALWARDRESPELFVNAQGGVAFPNWQSLKWPGAVDTPFRSSLDPGDRHMLVRQSAETWLGLHKKPIPPEPVDVEGLWLSALGAWLDLHGAWDTDPYSSAQIRSILFWDHVAPMGRDQYVRVVYPGYLFPFGHKTTLVKLTERKMKDAAPSVAGLYQRKFLVVGQPRRSYSEAKLPFIEIGVTPLVTPSLAGDPKPDEPFIPSVPAGPFQWVLHCFDKEGRPVPLVTPLVWVPDGYAQFSDITSLYQTIDKVPANGQDIAFAKALNGGDTIVATEELHFEGEVVPELTSSNPTLVDASVELPAVQKLSPIGPVTIEYSGVFLQHGFGGSQNVADVWAELPTPPKLSFGQGAAAGSDKAGGFLEPNLEIAGLSRVKGTVGDVVETAKGKFRPEEFLGSALPKLFGLVELVDLLDAVGVDLDDAPDVVSEALERIEGFLADLERAKKAVEDAVAEADVLKQRAQSKAAELQQQAQQAFAAAQQLETTVKNAVDDVIDEFANLPGKTEAQVAAALANPLQALGNATSDMEQVAPQLPPLVREQLLALAKTLRQLADAADLIQDAFRFVNGLASGEVQARFRYEWAPKLKPWPDPPDTILDLPDRGLVLAVEGRAAKDEMRVDVLAELKDFTLTLLPGEPLVRFKFDHLSFHGGNSAKPDVDVVLQKIEFLGFLGFIDTLRELIPFDGFSDPPFLDVTPEGLTAGFTLALPNVSVGVFNLSNMSLGADVQVPFLGKAVTVGFNFCTRERPFTLAVAFIGGGGWFLIRLSPDGLDVLELGLEAGAILAVDFGVASGSISAMLGIYMRLEGDEGSLSGYFRLRGEVDVLGLISASIELYLELTYEFDTGKMVGRAQITVKVEVFCFSTSVKISAERRFAGSVGDPSFADVMVLPDGTAPAWSKYCVAFAGA
jgi:prefoldin subunit 5